jgi:hypothetical protein
VVREDLAQVLPADLADPEAIVEILDRTGELFV